MPKAPRAKSFLQEVITHGAIQYVKAEVTACRINQSQFLVKVASSHGNRRTLKVMGILVANCTWKRQNLKFSLSADLHPVHKDKSYSAEAPCCAPRQRPLLQLLWCLCNKTGILLQLFLSSWKEEEDLISALRMHKHLRPNRRTGRSPGGGYSSPN